MLFRSAAGGADTADAGTVVMEACHEAFQVMGWRAPRRFPISNFSSDESWSHYCEPTVEVMPALYAGSHAQFLLCSTEVHRVVSVTVSKRSNYPTFNHSELRIEYPSR